MAALCESGTLGRSRLIKVVAESAREGFNVSQDELLVLGLGPMETPGEAGEGESQARLTSQQIECLGAGRLGLVRPGCVEEEGAKWHAERAGQSCEVVDLGVPDDSVFESIDVCLGQACPVSCSSICRSPNASRRAVTRRPIPGNIEKRNSGAPTTPPRHI